MRSLGRTLAAGAVFGALYALTACNAVLGIEKAELDTTTTTTQAVCSAGQGVSLATCTPTATAVQTCEECQKRECLSNTQLADCPNNSACRTALASYRSCQQSDCTDPTGDCALCLTESSGASCLSRCEQECRTVEVMAWCKSYCSCMGTNCAGASYAVGDGGVQDCMSFCEGQSLWRLNCLLTHCELAPIDTIHCDHANDVQKTCPDMPPNAAVDCPKTKSLTGYGCRVGTDCCSGYCRHGQCSDR